MDSDIEVSGGIGDTSDGTIEWEQVDAVFRKGRGGESGADVRGVTEEGGSVGSGVEREERSVG